MKQTNYVAIERNDVFLQLAPMAFDASTFEVWGALLNGGRIALAAPGMLSLDALGETIERQCVTTMWLTAPLFEQMVDTQLHRLGGVRQILAGGDVLSPRHVRRALDALAQCTIVNGYGPTENTTFTTCFRVPRAWPASAALPIGRPVSRTTVYVLDERRKAVPIGVTGELYAGGDGVALGYLNRPELTAECFVPDPFAGDPAARMYRTGDFARWRPDGTLEFLGRSDGQLKIRGFRVEPGEVEAALCAHPSVREAVVVGRADASGAQRLVAYVVATPDAVLETETLRRFLGERVPAHLIPARLVALDALPLTPSGKLDRRRLPEPGDLNSADRPPRVAPRSALEAFVASMWREVLDDEHVGINDGFFALGGHSLAAMRLLSRLRDALGIELPFHAFFEGPTVAQMATALRSRESKPGSLERIAQITLDVQAMSPAELHLAASATPTPSSHD